MNKLTINNLCVNIQNKSILNRLSLQAQAGDIIAVLGPNGAGKSTLLKSIMHHFSTDIKNGTIIYNKHNLTKLTTDAIARLGIFYAIQNPIELEGVAMVDFLKMIANRDPQNKIPLGQLFTKVQASMKALELPSEIINRNVNVGFSGGQKKKNEILQAQLFEPSVILLDEIDSGLDVDAMKIISKYITQNRKQRITIIVSHHIEFLNIIKPNKVIVLVNGAIAQTGGLELVKSIETGGYRKFMTSKPKEDFEKTDPYLTCHR